MMKESVDSTETLKLIGEKNVDTLVVRNYFISKHKLLNIFTIQLYLNALSFQILENQLFRCFFMYMITDFFFRKHDY